MNVISVLPKDAIQSIDDPEFGDEYIGDPDDDVLTVVSDVDLDANFDADSVARAYPLRILNYHEIVNDEVDGEPVAITWCPICGSAVVYDATVNGRRLTFGVSGKLADDDLVLYDRQTDSEWKQSTGECIAGELEGAQLSVRSGPMTTYAAFREAHPDGLVLQPVEDGSASARDYDPSGYDAYASGEGFGLRAMRGEGPKREWDRDDLDPKTMVLGVTIDGDALGFPLPRLEVAGGVVTATVGGTDVVVIATEEGLHAFEQPDFELVVEDGTAVGDGTTWSLATGESEDGRRLRRVRTRRLYAFAWQDDHGADAFYLG